MVTAITPGGVRSRNQSTSKAVSSWPFFSLEFSEIEKELLKSSIDKFFSVNF